MNWIADLIARINNARMLEKQTLIARGTKMNLAILDVMKKGGFIVGYESIESKKLKQAISITLNYSQDGECSIRGIKIISKPSLRVYSDKDGLMKYVKRFSCAIVSTSQGIMSSKEAIERNLGGEVLCEVF